MATNVISPDDESDSFTIIEERPNEKCRKVCPTRTHMGDECYNMSYPKMGQCHVFAYHNYKDKKIKERISEPEDTQICEEVFEKLGYEVFVHRNLTSKQVELKLSEIQNFDHSAFSSLVMILMSHGNLKEKTEYFYTYDGKMETSILWEKFNIGHCPSLAGKPKLFFIQTCRGNSLDYGAVLVVDSDDHDYHGDNQGHDYHEDVQGKENERHYVISCHSDMLIMFASYSGMLAFKTAFGGSRRSVFIHHLCEILREEGTQKYLSTLLLKITRKVALEYESHYPGDASLSNNKQIPQTMSTLMREVCFDQSQTSQTKEQETDTDEGNTRGSLLRMVSWPWQ